MLIFIAFMFALVRLKAKHVRRLNARCTLSLCMFRWNNVPKLPVDESTNPAGRDCRWSDKAYRIAIFAFMEDVLPGYRAKQQTVTHM